MKKLLFVFSVLTLLSYGCNRSTDNTSGTGSGIQKEEERGVQDFDSGSSQESSSQVGSQNMDQAIDPQNMDEGQAADSPSTDSSQN